MRPHHTLTHTHIDMKQDTHSIARRIAGRAASLAESAASADDIEDMWKLMHNVRDLCSAAIQVAEVALHHAEDAAPPDAGTPPVAATPTGDNDDGSTEDEDEASDVPAPLRTLKDMFAPDDPSADLTTEQDVDEFKSTLVSALRDAYAIDDDDVSEVADTYKEMGRVVIETARKRVEQREKAATDTDDFDDVFNRAWDNV